MKKSNNYDILLTLIMFIFLLYMIVGYNSFESFLYEFFPKKGIFTSRSSLLTMVIEHLQMVALSSLLSIIAGICLGIFAVSPIGYEFKSLIENIASFLETFPSAAIIALSVPIVGYGFKPAVIALFAYGILPVLMGTIYGIENIDEDIVTAAYGMGMDRFQIVKYIQLPLAKPIIIGGIRTSVVVNISAATISSTVGAGGLGGPIVQGVLTFDPTLIILGALPVVLISLIVDNLIKRAE